MSTIELVDPELRDALALWPLLPLTAESLCRDVAHSVCGRHPAEVCYRRSAEAQVGGFVLPVMPRSRPSLRHSGSAE